MMGVSGLGSSTAQRSGERGFPKMHVSVDVKGRRILSMRVTDEGVRGSTMLKPLIYEALSRCDVEGVLADSGYDTRSNFNYMDERGRDPGLGLGGMEARRPGGS